MIRILIADDHAIAREGVFFLCNSVDDFSIEGEVSNGREAIAFINKQIPDIAIMDISMPEINGIEVAANVSQRGIHTKAIILTVHKNAETACKAIKAGAGGCIEG